MTRHKFRFFTILVMALALIISRSTLAEKIYQWTDEEGVTHFSDTPPEDASMETREIELTKFEDSQDESDQYSITNQVEQLAEWRRQKSEERLARRQLKLEEQRLAQELEISRRYELLNAQTQEPRYIYADPYPFYPHLDNIYNHPRRHDHFSPRRRNLSKHDLHKGFSGEGHFRFRSRHVKASTGL